MDKFYLGSSYYPEWWSEEQWETDFSKMEELGFNVVRMGEFAWSWFEPEEGKYNFEPMLRAMDCAQKHGISVVMGTTTAVCPPWLHKKHPQVKGGNVNGKYTYGGRKGLCLSDKVFLKYAKKITEEQAKALGSHPALIGWQLDNEPGFPFWEFDETCTEGFRKWLKKKYGTIDKLNKAWFTMMWSNVYTDFDEIDIPFNSSEGGWTPEIQLDYRRYFSFIFNRLLKSEADLVRKYSPDRFIYTNWPGANWSVDCFEATKYLDYAAWDNYVGQPNKDKYRIQLRASMEHSFDRRLSNGKNEFLVAEQKAYTDPNTKPEVMAAQTWLNISHGAFGTIFFEWVSPLGGAEQGYGGVVRSDRSFRPETKPVIQKLSEDIKKYYPLIAGSQTKSQIAAVYSYENSWGSPGWVVDGPYDEDFFNFYGGFKNKLRTNIDVIGIDDDFSDYRMILLGNHRMMTEKQANKIQKFVANGGIVVMNPENGIRYFNNQMRELLKPGLLADVAGTTVSSEMPRDEFEKQTDNECTVYFGNGNSVHAGKTIYVLDSDKCETAAIFTHGLLKDKTAVSVSPYGKGSCVLFASVDCDIYYYEALAEFVAERFEFKPIMRVEEGIIVSSRTKGNREYIFAVNMVDSENYVKISKEVFDVKNEEYVSGCIALAPYETGIYIREK